MPNYVYLWCTIMVALLWAIMLMGCGHVQQGPPVDAATIAVPKVVDEAAAKPDPPAPVLPPPPRSGFRVWIPRQVTANGDVYEGHYVEVSAKTPQKELAKPDYEIPKAPKQVIRPVQKSGVTPAATARPAVQPAPRPAPAPWLQQPQVPPPQPQPLQPQLPLSTPSSEDVYDPTGP